MESQPTADHHPDGHYDVIVVGAGFAGLYMLHRCRQAGLRTVVIEAGSGPGGTWYWNRYPGARCDVDSLDYCYGFDPDLLQEWEWSERFATQPEILRYIEHVVERFDLGRNIVFDTRVSALEFDEASSTWHVTTSHGSRPTSRFCVMATGSLSHSNTPDFPGFRAFAGSVHHTGRWPQDPVDFSGKRVGVIGTGSSGIQAIPEIAETAEHLYVFQRTPNFTIPARNAPLDPDFVDERKRNYADYKRAAMRTRAGYIPQIPPAGPSAAADDEERRTRELELRWQHGGNLLVWSYEDLLRNSESNDLVADFVRSKIAEIVDSPETAALLTPTDHHIATKRICVDTDYYATFNRPDVTLVDLRSDPIATFTQYGLVTEQQAYHLDMIVLATGYDAMTGALMNIPTIGRNGTTIQAAWADGPATYLGLGIHGLPNYFVVAGPGSPSVRANMVAAIEQHVDWITRCIAYLDEYGFKTIEATAEAQEKWVDHVAALADDTLFATTRSWYSGSNIEGKPNVFAPYLGGLDVYGDEIDAAAGAGYSGFSLER